MIYICIWLFHFALLISDDTPDPHHIIQHQWPETKEAGSLGFYRLVRKKRLNKHEDGYKFQKEDKKGYGCLFLTQISAAMMARRRTALHPGAICIITATTKYSVQCRQNKNIYAVIINRLIDYRIVLSLSFHPHFSTPNVLTLLEVKQLLQNFKSSKTKTAFWRKRSNTMTCASGCIVISH